MGKLRDSPALIPSRRTDVLDGNRMARLLIADFQRHAGPRARRRALADPREGARSLFGAD